MQFLLIMKQFKKYENIENYGSEIMKEHTQSVAIILNYNDWETTMKSVHIHAQSNVFDKIVVVDNCSSDDSYERLMKIKNNDIDVIRTTKNSGYGYGNNFGANFAIKKYKPKYLVVINPDVVVDKESIDNCINILNNNNEIGLIAPIMKNGNGEISQSFAWRRLTFYQEIISIFFVFKKIFKSYRDNIYYKFYELVGDFNIVDVVPGSLMIFRKEAFAKAGMYDENVFLFVEERIICNRLNKFGYRVAINNNYFFTHFHSTTIKKSLTEYNRFKILLESKKYFINNYSNFTRVKKILFLFCFPIAKLERILFVIPLKTIRNFMKQSLLFKYRR